MDTLIENPRIIAALRRARRICKPVHATQRASLVIDARRHEHSEWDHPHREEVRRVAIDALDAVGLEFWVEGWETRDDHVHANFSLALFDGDQVVEVERWECSVPLDARDSTMTLAAQAAVTVMEIHTLRHRLRMPVLPNEEDIPVWMRVSTTAPASAPTEAPRVELVLAPSEPGDLTDLPTPVEPAPAIDELALRKRVFDRYKALPTGPQTPTWEELVRKVVSHGRRPLAVTDLARIDAHLATMERSPAAPQIDDAATRTEAADSVLDRGMLMALTPSPERRPSKDSPPFRCSLAYLAAGKAGMRKTFDEVVAAVIGPGRKDPANDDEWLACATWLEEHTATLERANAAGGAL